MKLPRFPSDRLPRKLIPSPTQTIVSQSLSKLAVAQESKKPIDDLCQRAAVDSQSGRLVKDRVSRSPGQTRKARFCLRKKWMSSSLR